MPAPHCRTTAQPIEKASASLADSAHFARLAPQSSGGDYILLITILVAFLEAPAQQLQPFQPQVVMGFSGVIRQKPTG